MDQDLHDRIESLEELCRATLEAVGSLRSELDDFRKEQQVASTKTQGLLRQLGARLSGVEGRMNAVEERIEAVEDVVFSSGQEASSG